MAVLSAYERLVSVMPATIAAVLGIDAACVYPARRGQAVLFPVDVSLVDGGWTDVSRGGTHSRCEQAVLIFVRVRSTADGARTGGAQARTLANALALLVSTFRGARPWASELPDLITTRASLVATDADPNNVGLVQGSVRLGAFFKGDGAAEETP